MAITDEQWSKMNSNEALRSLIYPYEKYLQEQKEYNNNISDGSTASYYQLPTGCSELQDLISYRNMNAQIGEIFRECFRYGIASHSDEVRGIKKIIYYANAELKRLSKNDH